ncbi:MAG: alpha/beta hydrolase family protein, partial [Candidatus Acidiferrales bacterium]
MRDSRRALPVILVVSLSLALAMGAAAKRPITFDDLISFGRVSDPQISPDGKWVAYTVDRYDKANNSRSSAIWLASLETGENRQLTRSDKRDSRPRWAPDGKSLAFLSNRSGSWQVWSIRLDGGEATQLTKLPVDISTHNWSPDGHWLLFLADVYPDCHDAAKPGAALECAAKRDEEKEKSKVKAVLYDRLMIRHWNVWMDGKRGHIFVIAADGSGEARDLTPGDSSIPPFLDGSDAYDVSPDSKELVFARNADKDEARSTNGEVWTAPLAGGEIKKITTNPAWDGSPQYSPDGKWIAYLAMARAGFEADHTRLVLCERATGKTRELTADFDNNVGDFLWAPDSQKIYFESSVNAASSFYQVAVSGGAINAVLKTGTNSSPSLSPDGKTFAFTRQFLHRPAEVYTSGVETGEAQQLSHINDARVAELDMSPAES